MGVIKLVTNGDNTATFKAVSLGHAATIFFGLVSIIGALGTWNLAITWDRSMLVSMIREEMALTMKADNTATTLALAQLDGRLRDLEQHVHEQEKQIIKNTQRLDHIAEAWKK
jgi:hypothetical protein